MTYAFKAPARPVSRVFLHCSDSDNPAHDDVAVITRWHTSPDPKDGDKPYRDDSGRPACGYHLFVTKGGVIQPGRALESRPTAQRWHNKGTIAVCLSGKNNFTEEQFAALRDLCRQVHEQLPLATFHGHREVNPNKSCPRFAYSLVLGLDAKGRLT
jgi:N-acetylmuramoyl-L-alanine amidase